MRRHLLALCVLTAAAPACKVQLVEPDRRALVRLARADDGAIEVRLENAPQSPRALELELSLSGGLVLEDPSAPAGLPLDTVRLKMRSPDLAVLFSADKRGIKLPRDGAVARLRPRGTGRVAISRALLADTAGAPIPVLGGDALSVR